MSPYMPGLILASGSRYRRALLSRLVADFRCLPPEVDESPGPGEAPAALAGRLAELKARTISGAHPGEIVIGSDQVAALGTQVLGKPGSAERALAQLSACSGHTVIFYTAVTVIGPGDQLPLQHTDCTAVDFRPLDREEIRRYLEREPALDCAGSFRAEGLGITLFRAIRTTDPTALQGLPLIWLAGSLRRLGLPLP